MDIRFYIDPETEMPHIHEHGVTEEEALQVLSRRGQEIKGTGNSLITLGQTAAGRYLKVVTVPRRDGRGLMVITSYDLRGKELKAYRRYRRRRSR